VRPLRLGAVSYLNTKPLVWGLAERLPDAELSFDLPSRLAEQLATGKLDIALIPSVEAFQDPGYRTVSNACIATRGPVWSVKLFGRVLPEQVRTLALDEGSRTSAALVKILLAEQYGIYPRCEPLPMTAGPNDTTADAVLLIGDRAIHEPPGPWSFVWDLGDAWTRWTELPFVFAMWTARAGLSEEWLLTANLALTASRDEGLHHLTEIAEREASGVRLTPEACFGYLNNNLYFRFGRRELAGLRQFYQRAARLQLAPAGLPWLVEEGVAP
jgi:chorismate dehydratase